MTHTDRLAAPLYLVASALLVVPAVDFFLQTWPQLPGQASWRFGAVMLVSGSTLTPLLGLVLLLVAGVAFEHRSAVILAALLSTITMLVLLACAALFPLEGMEVRALVANDARRRFDVNAAGALVKLSFALLVSAGYVWAGWRAARSLGRRSTRRSPRIVATSAASRSESVDAAGSSAG